MRSHKPQFKIAMAFIVSLCCSSCGPHMIEQPSIKPYKIQVPDMPLNSVPTQGRIETLTEIQSRAAKNPLPATPVNIHNGELYYQYYCLMCHGKYGDGNGPVGQSYLPRPTSLYSSTVRSMTDGQLYQSMLEGLGHDPVMIETVPPDHRWPLVIYVRTFAKNAQGR